MVSMWVLCSSKFLTSDTLSELGTGEGVHLSATISTVYAQPEKREKRVVLTEWRERVWSSATVQDSGSLELDFEPR